jgi:hypothetical protein
MRSTDTRAEGVAALEQLAAELDPGTFAAAIVGDGQVPCLRIINRRAPQLTEDVYAGRGFYWYSWAERLAPVDDVPRAVARIAKVLRTITEPSR